MSDIHALVGAYAVDALDDIERQQFERHLADCADCRAEVASLREASAMLSSTTSTPPPPALKDSIMAGIATVRPLPPEVPGSQRVGHRTPRRHRFRGLVAAAAAVAVIGGGGALIATQPWSDSGQTVSVADRILQAGDARSATVEIDGAQAELVRSESQGRAVLVTHDLPPAPEGKVYQLWLQSPEGEMLPAGLLDGGADTRVVLDGDAASATAAGITVEPDGGSPSPTSAPIALFDFGQLA